MGKYGILSTKMIRNGRNFFIIIDKELLNYIYYCRLDDSGELIDCEWNRKDIIII